MWKRFTASILCLASAIMSFACGFVEIPGQNNTYMFKTYDMVVDTWNEENKTINANVDFWYRYTKGNIDKETIKEALYKSSIDDINNGQNGFYRYLNSTNDTDALRYWTINKKLIEKMGDSWYYPKQSDKDEVYGMVNELESLYGNCTSPLLKERFFYIYMRSAFYLRDYERCQKIWENCELPWQDNDTKRKCYLYYAGALFYSGETCRAADIYGEESDWQSLLYFKKDVDFLRQLYQHNPNSKAFLFFVQNYENSYQDGKTAEAANFTGLCNQILSENKTDNPALWQSALAHIAFLDGNLTKALELIGKAVDMKGDDIVIDNTRMLKLLYNAANTNAVDYDDKLYADLQWIQKRVIGLDHMWANNGKGFKHCLNILARVVFKYAFPHYVDTGNHKMAAAMLNFYDEAYCYDHEYRDKMRKGLEGKGSLEYSTFYFNYLDTTSVENVKDYLAFVKSGGKTNLEKSLIRCGYVNESMMNELIGTKYIRVHNYDSAIIYLEKVKPDFKNRQNITDYLKKNPFLENWIGSNDEKGKIYGKYNPAAKYESSCTKLQFCMIMKAIEEKLRNSEEKEKAILYYAYAVGLEQSENWCWALTQYGKSSSYWIGGLYQNFQSIESLQTYDNGWDYKSSRAYVMQQRLNNINNCLDNAERLANNNELAARCQYMRAAIEPDRRHAAEYYRHISEKYTNTKFISNEKRHCSILADYR